MMQGNTKPLKNSSNFVKKQQKNFKNTHVNWKKKKILTKKRIQIAESNSHLDNNIIFKNLPSLLDNILKYYERMVEDCVLTVLNSYTPLTLQFNSFVLSKLHIMVTIT